jgi:hypothetical protein
VGQTPVERLDQLSQLPYELRIYRHDCTPGRAARRRVALKTSPQP